MFPLCGTCLEAWRVSNSRFGSSTSQAYAGTHGEICREKLKLFEVCGKVELVERVWLLKIEDQVGREKRKELLLIDMSIANLLLFASSSEKDSSDCHMKNVSMKTGY